MDAGGYYIGYKCMCGMFDILFVLQAYFQYFAGPIGLAV